jgi:hypothetical protein
VTVDWEKPDPVAAHKYFGYILECIPENGRLCLAVELRMYSKER